MKIKHIILLVMVLFLRCYNAKKEKKEIEKFDRDFFLFSALFTSTGETWSVKDNNDGTLVFNYTMYINHGLIREEKSNSHFIRKCLIGQTYDPVANNCRGTGTYVTTWDAKLFPFCHRLDYSCENNGIADNQLSPAAQACATDSYLGKKWRLFRIEDNLAAYIKHTQKSYTSDYINYYSNDYYLIWTANSISKIKARYELYDAYERDNGWKIDLYFVLCVEDK